MRIQLQQFQLQPYNNPDPYQTNITTHTSDTSHKTYTPNNYLPKFLHSYRSRFLWQLLRFLVLNYYLLETVLASTFKSMYIVTVTTLLPLNIILFIFLALDLAYKFALVEIPTLPNHTVKKKSRVRQNIRIAKYFLITNKLLFDVVVLLLFYVSYMVPFSVARYFRLVITLRILQIVEFNQQIYLIMHNWKTLTKIYTILKITYIMFIFSHYFGCWFYLMDQVLLQQQYYGPPSTGNQLYYQMNMLCFTPIEQLGDWGRYLYGLYFLVSLITTIAYGDIIGKNPYQQVYVTFLMVLSTISIGMILQQFMMIVRDDSLRMYEFIKNYNSLKICMDDSFVSLKTQNKVRSYLVYSQYEKKYHAHEQVTQKLTQKLQQQLKYQAYNTSLTPIFNNLFQIQTHPHQQPTINLINNNLQLKSLLNMRELCNLCSEISFQAQTDIYGELITTDWKSKCNFLYKIQGNVRQYITLGRNYHYQNSISHKKIGSPFNQHSEGSGNVFLPSQNKNFYNLSQMLLNYNYKGKGKNSYTNILDNLQEEQEQGDQQGTDEMQEGQKLMNPFQVEELNENQGFIQEKTTRRPDIYRFYLRGLMSVKISHFIILKFEDFENYLTGRQELKKEIRNFREKIYCQEIDLRKIGMQCSICDNIEGDKTKIIDHTTQFCPKLHYIYSSKILNAQCNKHQLALNVNKRQKYSRKKIKSQKLYNKPHQSALIMRILSLNKPKSLQMEQQKKKQQINEDIDKQKVKTFEILKKILHKIIRSEEKDSTCDIDSLYDPDSFDQKYCLQESLQ